MIRFLLIGLCAFTLVGCASDVQTADKINGDIHQQTAIISDGAVKAQAAIREAKKDIDAAIQPQK